MQTPEMGGKLPHDPVLYQEVLTALKPSSGGRYLDGTIGAGGHAFGILEASDPDGKLLGLDVDPHALEIARVALARFKDRVTLIQGSYTELDEFIIKSGWEEVDGILLDFGVSSMQLNTPERGFSFSQNAPLDMRFDPLNPINVCKLVNELPEDELADLIYEYGEEKLSRRIAREVVKARPIDTTGDLADIVKMAVGTHYGKQRIHPATRTFQALRIAVNDELGAVTRVLPKAIRALKPAGRLAVISFHSLEDRIVKTFFRREGKDCICPPEQLVCVCNHKATIKEVTRRPIQPDEAEIAKNNRARSARLRVAERVSGT